MSHKYRQQLNTFTVNDLPTLDVAVLGALELLTDSPLPSLSPNQFQRPIVVGSGNAEAAGRIIFRNTEALFLNENNFKEQLDQASQRSEVVIVSASGSKHAPLIAKQALAANKQVSLITTAANSPAQEILESEAASVLVYPKNREPYTYNTSTYMAMLQSAEPENIESILNHINTVVNQLDLPDFASYQKYYLIVPPEFAGIIRMLQVKFIELFGRQIARDIETSEYVSHATTVVPSDELFIAFGVQNDTWGQPADRLDIPLPKDAGYVAIMAVSYYLIGLIQRSQPAYFADNIVDYCQFISQVFNQDIAPIVAGS